MFASDDLKHISDGQVVRGAMTQERMDRVHGRAGNGFGGVWEKASGGMSDSVVLV